MIGRGGCFMSVVLKCARLKRAGVILIANPLPHLGQLHGQRHLVVLDGQPGSKNGVVRGIILSGRTKEELGWVRSVQVGPQREVSLKD